jgi:hypothetical protein
MDPQTPSNAIFVTLQKCKKKIARPWLKIPCRGQFDQGSGSLEWDFGGKIFLKYKILSEFADFKNGIFRNRTQYAVRSALKEMGHEIEFNFFTKMKCFMSN